MTAALTESVAVRTLPTIAELVPFNAGHSAMIECGSSSVWAKVKAKKPGGGISLFHFSDRLAEADRIIARDEAKKMNDAMRRKLKKLMREAA